MDAGPVQHLVTGVRLAYLRHVWEQTGIIKMSFGDATNSAFQVLAYAPPEIRLRVTTEKASETVLFTLHGQAAIPWYDASNDPMLVEQLMAVLSADPEPQVTVFDTTKAKGVHSPKKTSEFVLSPAINQVVAEIYEPAEWALPFLRHIFTRPDDWDEADHNHAVNVLWGVLKDTDIPAGRAIFTRAERMNETGANPDTWKDILNLLTNPLTALETLTSG
jgi:hypothetical protein